LGYIVSKPVNQGVSYDRIVDTGRIYKVQIKCLWYAEKENGKYRMHFKKKNNNSYDSDGIDYFAAYIKNLDCWYIIPALGIKSKIVSDEYKERWDFFKTV
jgi:hypothetical protein